MEAATYTDWSGSASNMAAANSQHSPATAAPAAITSATAE